jgi:hypothetical protein
MSIVSDFLNLLGVHVERPRFGDIEQIDADTYRAALFDKLLNKQMAEQQRRSRIGRNPQLFDRLGALDR